MCDYSLQSVKTRPAVVGDKLVTKNFGTGTRGFAGCTEGDYYTAICLLPGTELAFDEPITTGVLSCFDPPKQLLHKTAIFRQINKDQERTHHDALELPDGEQLLLTYITEGQRATVLQLPVNPEQRIPYNEGATRYETA